MTAEIWDSSEKLGDFTWKGSPEVGDVLELAIEGEKTPYEVEKIINYYAIGADEPAVRIVVKYAGPGWASFL